MTATAIDGDRALGVDVRVLVTDPAAASAARTLVQRELIRIDTACSRFRADSELSRLVAGTGPQPVGPALAEAIEVALRAARLSDGLVDPTVGSALVAAGYDRDFTVMAPDGPPLTEPPVPVPGWHRVQFDRLRSTVSLPAGVRLDLGATAKALAADRAARTVAAELGCGVLVGLGGDIALAGPPPPGGWRVRVQDCTGHPDAPSPGPTGRSGGDTTGPVSHVLLRDGGLATSGVTARSWTRGDQLLHHVIDPLTGAPADSPWRTVSVLAATCVAANTASTAALVVGWPALPWLAGLGLAARLVRTDGTVHLVGGWPR